MNVIIKEFIKVEQLIRSVLHIHWSKVDQPKTSEVIKTVFKKNKNHSDLHVLTTTTIF